MIKTSDKTMTIAGKTNSMYRLSKDQYGERNCFILLKDHKENFQNNLSVPLISPAKKKLRRLSTLLEKRRRFD